MFLEDTAVKGLSSRMFPMRLTTSGHEMVWISACKKVRGGTTNGKWKKHVRYLEKMGVEIVHVD
jgi:hypothetical protein